MHANKLNSDENAYKHTKLSWMDFFKILLQIQSP